MSETSDPGDLGSIHEHGCSDSPLAGQGMYPLLRLPPLAGQPESKCISNLSAPGKLKNQKTSHVSASSALGGLTSGLTSLENPAFVSLFVFSKKITRLTSLIL